MLMIKFKMNHHIAGIWFAERIKLGRVYIYAFKENKGNIWTGRIRYVYYNLAINISHDEDSHHNIFIHENIKEEEIIKICNDKWEEFYCIFNHNKDKLIVKGNLETFIEKSKGIAWMPLIRESTIIK